MEPATILVLEDDPVIRTFLADNLTADGYELLVADCLHDAQRLIELFAPDLAVFDLALPDGSGLELIRRIRAADGVASRLDPALPVIVLSASAGELDRVRGFERGADDYVCKPTCPVVSRRVERLATPSSSSMASGRSSGTSASSSPS